MKNNEVSELLRKIAQLLEIKEDIIFKIRAYEKAALVIENLDEDIAGNNVAEVELAFGTTQIGRGHLNAGSASIIVDTLESPAEIHFIDNAQTILSSYCNEKL